MIERFKTHAKDLSNVKYDFESDLRRFLLLNNNSIEINYTENDDIVECFYTDWNGDVRRSPITKIYLEGEVILLNVQDNHEELYLFNGDVLTYETMIGCELLSF